VCDDIPIAAESCAKTSLTPPPLLINLAPEEEARVLDGSLLPPQSEETEKEKKMISKKVTALTCRTEGPFLDILEYIVQCFLYHGRAESHLGCFNIIPNVFVPYGCETWEFQFQTTVTPAKVRAWMAHVTDIHRMSQTLKPSSKYDGAEDWRAETYSEKHVRRITQMPWVFAARDIPALNLPTGENPSKKVSPTKSKRTSVKVESSAAKIVKKSVAKYVG
jgi:hypothetical protein